MVGAVDWNAVTWSVIAIALIVLTMSPLFWWLYDSDRFSSRYWPRISAIALAFTLGSSLIQHAARDEWWWVGICAVGLVAGVIVVVWEFRRKDQI